MQLRFTKEADFRQERDFGAKIGATLEFLAAHWRPLGKCLVYFVLPVALLMGIGLGMITNGMFNMIGAAKSNPAALRQPSDMFGVSYFIGMALAMIGGVAAYAVLLSTIYAYVRLLLTEQPSIPPTPAQVWQQIVPWLGRMILALGMLFGLYLLLMMVLSGFIGLLGGGTAAVLFFLLFIPVLFYVVVPLSLYFPTLWIEDTSVLAALRRCFYLALSHWWASFGLLIVAGIIQGCMAILFVLPQYAVIIGKTMRIPGLDSDALGIAAQCLYAGGLLFSCSIPLLAVLFQYFNLVERKEGVGLRTLVDSLGTGQVPVAYNHALRPDDEGEY